MGSRNKWITALFVAISAVAAWAAANGSLSGTLKDPSGAVVPGADITLLNSTLKTQFKAISDGQGFYSFPALPAGQYDLTVEASGFKTVKRTGLIIDTDVSLKVDLVLKLGQKSDTVVVAASDASAEVQLDTRSTQLGELVTASQMTALPLNGRSFTDLLSIQPGIIPITTLLPNSVIMAGVTGSLSPSGDLNPGNLSTDGQRESSNGFLVNGIDVQEHMNGGTSIVPNLDSVDEFRVFNVFNHAQFYGPASVDGEVNDPHFGQIVSAAAPRLVQLATRFTF
jgi:Carboxypeptidase regulatory-like domain